eukprot:jgi/Botrbrau1/1530/Bobra.0107s0018.1
MDASHSQRSRAFRIIITFFLKYCSNLHMQHLDHTNAQWHASEVDFACIGCQASNTVCLTFAEGYNPAHTITDPHENLLIPMKDCNVPIYSPLVLNLSHDYIAMQGSTQVESRFIFCSPSKRSNARLTNIT